MSTQVLDPGFHSINDGNQDEIIFAPAYNKEWFDELDGKYSWDNFNEYNNRFWEYWNQLFDTLRGLAKDETSSEEDFFNQLTRGQKIFYCVQLFAGETDNGGVYQFFFNRPMFCFAVLETLKELKMDTLSRDYEKCLNEFMGSADSYVKRKTMFGNSKKSWEKRWEAFTEGYNDIKSAQAIEAYFYKEHFKKEFYKTVVDYIDNHLDQFVKY